MSPRAHGWHAAALLACLILLTGWAWQNRNLIDDAFIGLRHAENFAKGGGLVWNPGEHKEGFSGSFLWVVLLGLALKAGLPSFGAIFTLNLAFFVVSLLLFYRIARNTLDSPWHALAAVALLGTNFSYSLSGTLGIGTHLETSALLACTAVLLGLAGDPLGRGKLALLSTLGAIAVLVRMDSLLPVGILFVAAIERRRRVRTGGALTLDLATLLAPGGLILVAWTLWKWSYYGELLPTTFDLKVLPGANRTIAGLYYLYSFLLSYFLIFEIPVVAAALWQMRTRTPWLIVTSVAIWLTWFAYVVRLGGDYIEFRFLAPVLPFLLLSIYWSVLRVTDSRPLRCALLGLIVLGSVNHQIGFGRLIYANAVYRPSLAIVTVPPDSTHVPMLWSEFETGQFLGREFDHDPNLRIAIGAAGVIPYYTKFWTLDLLGLSDPWIARNGRPLRFGQFVEGFYPGHVRVAPIPYVVQNGVQLFLGVGTLTRDDVVDSIRTLDDLMAVMFLQNPDLGAQIGAHKSDFPPDARVVEIPVRPGYKLLAIYLTKSPHVDEVLAARKWHSYPLSDLSGS